MTWSARVDEEQSLTSPEELLAAAHASCFAMQFTHGLVGAGGEPEEMHVSARGLLRAGLGITALGADRAGERRAASATRSSARSPSAPSSAALISRALAGIEVTLELPDLAPPDDEEAAGEAERARSREA